MPFTLPPLTRAFTRLALAIVIVAMAGHAAAKSTYSYYGEGICSAGYDYEVWQQCEDTSQPPLKEFEGQDEELCGSFETDEDEDGMCRLPEHGVENSGIALIYSIGYVSVSRTNYEGTIGTDALESKCNARANAEFPTMLPSVPPPDDPEKQRFLMLTGTHLENVSDQSNDCTKRNIFNQCEERVKSREAECFVTRQQVSYILKASEECPAESEKRIEIKTCVVYKIYPTSARPECPGGYKIRSAPFANLGLLKNVSTGNFKCLSGEDQKDETTAELRSKVDFLLKMGGNNDSHFGSFVEERNTAFLRYLLKTRGAELTAEQQEKIFKLNPNIGIVDSLPVPLAESDLKIRLGALVETLQGNKREIYASMPRYADAVAVCLNDLQTCNTDRTADWLFLNLNRYVGGRYVFSAAIPDVPTTYSVKAYLGGDAVWREITKGVNDQEELEPSLLAAGKLFLGFSHPATKKFKIVDAGTNQVVKSHDFNGIISPSGKLVYERERDFTDEQDQIKERDLNTGAVLRSWLVDPMFVKLMFRGEDPMLTNGHQVYDLTQNIKVTLAGAEDMFYQTTFLSNGVEIVADAGDHTTKIWDLATGALKATISYDPEQSYPVDDKIKFVGENIAVKAYNDDALRLYKTDGTLLKQVNMPTNDFVFSKDGSKIFYESGGKFYTLNVESNTPVEVIAAEANINRSVLSAPDDANEVLVYARKTIPGNNNTPNGGPLPSVDTIEVWDLVTKQRKKIVGPIADSLASLSLYGTVNYTLNTP